MKELSIEEKAKRYDKALKVLHKYDGANIMFSQSLKEEMFPELAESKDESIRKTLIKVVNLYYGEGEDEEKTACLNWLEKQGEQKPVFEMITPEESLGIDSNTYNKIVDECVYGELKPAWSEEDETALGDALWCCKQAASIAKDENDMGNVWYAETWLKSLKDRVLPQPKQEWSDDDEQYLLVCKNALAKYQTTDKWDANIIYHWLEDKLKSLRPQNTWKPSDEQMKALTFACIKNTDIDKSSIKALYDLKEQLKKLKE